MSTIKWKKLGMIFDPSQHKLPNDCVQFAQSPQALVFDDFVRIYFSTRAVDNRNGKYLSHIAFVDMRKNLRDVIRVSDKTVIPLGGLGCFDEHGIFPINPIRYGNKIYAYTCGWNRKVSVSVDTSIGFAISDDNGLTFKKGGAGPVLTSSLHEPFLVGDPFVHVYDKTFHMWYIFGTKWISSLDGAAPDRVYKIGHATSNNGIEWQKEGKQLITDKLNSDECQALPTVIDFNGKYHMFYCYRQATSFRKDRDRGYRIGYAYSEDLQHWIRDDENAGIDVTEDGWDSDMQCYPHVFLCDGKLYLLYNGNEFGRFGFGIAVLEEQ
jgi:hypothetical protein